MDGRESTDKTADKRPAGDAASRPLDAAEVQRRLRAFVAAREWDQFHTPKDLAVGLSVEAGELLEHFQWRAPAASELSADEREAMAHELADVTMYALLMADKLGIDLWQAVAAKLAINDERYPVAKAKGRATKYDRL